MKTKKPRFKTIPIIDETEREKNVSKNEYSVISYGADFDVNGLVERLRKGSIIIPKFQRNYIWNLNEASRFIESLLLGLPVPSVFLAKEQNSNKLLVIDGQQRLRSLQFFYDGHFKPKEDQKSKRSFRLEGVVKRFEDITYDKLNDFDKRQLDDSLIHAIIIRQTTNKNYDPSTHEVFRRLNTGGRKLTPQEIRVAINHDSAYIKFLNELNNNTNWRAIFGKPSDRLKDQELLLRFFAMFFNYKNYFKPMNEFLNSFLSDNANITEQEIKEHKKMFETTIDIIRKNIGTKAFKLKKGIVAAIFDAVMVGIATRVKKGKMMKPRRINIEYKNLLKDREFKFAINQHTSDEDRVAKRIEKAIEFISHVQ